MNPPISVSTLLRDIIETMATFGHNKSTYPFGIGYHENRWWTTVEMDTKHATFDIETENVELTTALSEALARLRREATIKGLVAT